MSVKTYHIQGTMRIKGKWQKFEMDCRATKPEETIEQVFSVLGSRHNLSRKEIRVQSSNEMKASESKNPLIKEIADVTKSE